MLSRPSTCRANTATIARSSRTLLAVAVTAGLYANTATPPAIAEESQSAEAYLADLVDQASQKQDQLNSVQNEMGGLREAANKSRVDLDRAHKEAQDAQAKTISARDRLATSEKDVNDAQQKLDEISRSAYQQGGHTSPVTLAAGEDTAAAQLDRASYVRLAAERQEATVDRLDLSRTQNANEDSRLRASRQDADSAVSKAVAAHKEAVAALQDSQEKLAQISAEVEKLKKQSEAASAKLRAAKSAIETLANTKPDATSFEKRTVAEKAAEGAEKAAESKSKPAAEPKPAEESKSAEESKEQSDSASAETQPTSEAAPTTTEQETPTQTEFEHSPAGDEQRQQAIDGLIASGASALVAGVGAAANGQDGQAALRAAREAGSSTAGKHYDAIIAGEQNASQVKSPSASTETVETPITENTSNTTVTTTETVEPEPEQEMPEDNPAQDAESQGVLVNPETGLQEEQPGEMPPVTSPQNSDLPPSDSSVNTDGTAEEKIERVIDRAMSQLGVQYAWGGGDANGPTLGIRDGGVADTYGDYNKIGFDCSGLTLYAFAGVGIQLEHYTGYQYQAGRQIPSDQAKRGDLLFWGPGASQHVAIYLGDGKMLEAPQSGDVVKISDVRYGGMTPYAVRLIE